MKLATNSLASVFLDILLLMMPSIFSPPAKCPNIIMLPPPCFTFEIVVFQIKKLLLCTVLILMDKHIHVCFI